MTRRAFLALRVIQRQEIEVQHASQKVIKVDHKNEDFSKSVSSFDFGPIFLPRSGNDLSRNVGLMSIYAVLKNPS